MLVSRDLIKKIEIFLKRKEYLAIIGPRQCGKTVFLQIVKDYLQEQLRIKDDQIKIITFEDRKLKAEFEKDAVAFVESYVGNSDGLFYLMIDEFQYVEEGGQKLKLIFDTVKNVKIIISGSSSLELKAKVGKYMVGRLLSFQLYPFNFSEFLEAEKQIELLRVYKKNNNNLLKWLLEKKELSIIEKIDVWHERMLEYFEEYILWGGYPAVVLSRTREEKIKLLSDIYNDFVLRDVKNLLEAASEKSLLDVSRYLATQIGNLLVYQNLSDRANLDYRNLLLHLSLLKETFVIDFLRPFFRNRNKELSKNPMVYFIDTGFRNMLMENFNNFDKRNDSGSLVENLVFVRLKEIFSEMGKINFWRTKIGAEVDFVIEHMGEVLPMEIKFSFFKKAQVPRSMLNFIKKYQPERGIVLTKDFWGEANVERAKILFVPVYYL